MSGKTGIGGASLCRSPALQGSAMHFASIRRLREQALVASREWASGWLSRPYHARRRRRRRFPLRTEKTMVAVAWETWCLATNHGDYPRQAVALLVPTFLTRLCSRVSYTTDKACSVRVFDWISHEEVGDNDSGYRDWSSWRLGRVTVFVPDSSSAG